MIDYKDFVIPEFYWDYFVREKRSLFISSYLKDNNILPSEDMIKNFIIDEKEREDFRRMLYSKYCISGVMPEIPNVPEIPDGDVIIPNNPNSGNSGGNIVIPESSGNSVNVMFDIDMDDIPEAVGVGNNIVNTIFKQGILNGDLLDKSYCDISLSSSSINIEIKDLTQIYSIPKGEYSITGIIGVKEDGKYDLTNESVNHAYLQYNTTVSIEENKLYYIKGDFKQNIIVSNDNFSIQYFYDGCNNQGNGGYDERISESFSPYTYQNYYYVFTNNFDRIRSSWDGFTWKDILGYNIIFNNVSYEIRKQQWVTGSSLYYNIINNHYDEWFTMVYNVTTTTEPTKLFSSGSVTSIGTMEIDGKQTDIVSEYTFNTLDKHEVKVLLKDTTKNGSLKFEDVPQLKELSIPSSINSLGSSFLYNCGGIEKIYSYAQKAPSIIESNSYPPYPTFWKINTNGILFIPQGSDYTEWLADYNNTTTLKDYNWTIKYME